MQLCCFSLVEALALAGLMFRCSARFHRFRECVTFSGDGKGRLVYFTFGSCNLDELFFSGFEISPIRVIPIGKTIH